MTGRDIITLALRMIGVVGVGQTAQAEDIVLGQQLMNAMIDQWNQRRWMVYHLLDLSKVATGAQSYTIGAGGDFNAPRPDRLESAFIRQVLSSPYPVDYPLRLLESREDYNRIAVKELATLPSYIWYDAAFPLGNVYVWPVPPADMYEIHLAVKSQLSEISDLSASINLPPAYYEALLYNLAARLRPAYGLPPDATIAALAAAATNTVQNANAQIPSMGLPSDLIGKGVYWGPADRFY